MKTPSLKETDLYIPIRDFLLSQGYRVQAEVNDCDLVGTKGDELLVVELKLNFNATLLVQATQRQRFADTVYVALPRPKGRQNKRWSEYRHLLRRLELGLMLVSFSELGNAVEVIFDPAPYRPRRQKKARDRVLSELAGRSRAYNIAGSSGQPLMTAYREAALTIASLLADSESPLTPRALRALGADSKVGRILYDNHYGWFARLGGGLYALTEVGRQALNDYVKNQGLPDV